MSRSTKIWLIIAACLIMLGLLALAVVMCSQQWDFSQLNTVKYETNTYTATQDFHDISIHSDTSDIEFKLSANDQCVITCYEEESAKHEVYTIDDTLTIRVANEKKWYEYISLNFSKPKITVYLPKLEYQTLTILEHTGDIEIPKTFLFDKIDVHISTGDIKNFASAKSHIQIKSDTGDIEIKYITSGSVSLSTSSGEIIADSIQCKYYFVTEVTTGECKINNVKCNGFNSSGTTGDIDFKDLIANESIFIERDTGDIQFKNCDAPDVQITTSTGDISGSFLTSKVIIANTSTGEIDIPESYSGGKCILTTTTGDIKIKIK